MKKRSLRITWCAGVLSVLFLSPRIQAQVITVRDLPGDSVSSAPNPESIAGNGTVEPSGSTTVSFPPQKDNTLYEDPAGQLSNGSGPYFFAGRTSDNLLRRGLIAFDLSSIPTNATITGANLRMRLLGGDAEVSLHKASRAWGEGASNAGDPGGDGTQAAANDATWLHNFYNASFWTTPGGDFSVTPSATRSIFVSGTYVWSGAALQSDVQDWVSNPGNNFGWVIRGDETTAGNIQRFYSRERFPPSDRPLLTVTYEGASPPPPPSTLGNISTRLRVLPGDNALIGGLIVQGTGEKRVILRAIGPTLTDLGVPGALANPTLELYQGNTLLFSNDDWQLSSQQAEIQASGLAPNNDAESAIIWTLTPGQSYTAIVRGANGTTGIGIVEAYDLDPTAGSWLGNISTRGFVDVGDNVMIAGLIVISSSSANLQVGVRALGPTLSDLGVPNALADPTLDLVNSNGTVIRSNNNWRDDPQQRAEIENLGLAPSHDEEAALVETVAPGAYTAIVRGNGSAPTGVALVEAYHIVFASGDAGQRPSRAR